MKEKRKTVAILLLCLMVGFALRFYSFDRKSLWLDEIYTYQDSRDGFKAQLNYYKEKPTYLHPPLFYMVTHLFYPFPVPERDLRTIPLIFGILSIPMIFFLARLFSRRAALPCAFALTFMTYHIALSQEARAYSFLLSLGIASLYFFMKHLMTGKKVFLVPTALLFALMFHTSYSSISFIAFSQLLWFYRPKRQEKKPTVTSVLLLNALIVILYCKAFHVTHFISSKYFVSFLPLLLISLSLPLDALRIRFERSRKPPGFGVVPTTRYYQLNYYGNPEGPLEYSRTVAYQNKTFVIYNSKTCCSEYVPMEIDSGLSQERSMQRR
jgi:predicted membrane-bound mannosyltransferase